MSKLDDFHNPNPEQAKRGMVTRGATICRICMAPADLYEHHYECEDNPSHIAPRWGNGPVMFTDVTKARDSSKLARQFYQKRMGLKLSDRLWIAAAGLAIGYLLASLLVFNIRHPWATQIEVLQHFSEAVRFDTVPYDEMRPR